MLIDVDTFRKAQVVRLREPNLDKSIGVATLEKKMDRFCMSYIRFMTQRIDSVPFGFREI